MFSLILRDRGAEFIERGVDCDNVFRQWLWLPFSKQ